MIGIKKLIFALSLVTFLGGCTTVGKLPKFPEVPGELLTGCPELSQVKPDSKLSNILEVVTDNYSEYHKCQEKVNSWTSWYNQQKENFNNL